MRRPNMNSGTCVKKQRPEIDSLMHYGIKGQTWGIRRFQNEDGTLTAAGKERYNTGKADSKRKVKTGSVQQTRAANQTDDRSKWKAKDAEHLSDDELNRRNSRLQRERQYKDLTTTQTQKDASQVLKDSLKRIFIGTATTLAVAAMTKNYKKVQSFIEKVAHQKYASIKASQILSQEIRKRQIFDSHSSSNPSQWLRGKYAGER